MDDGRTLASLITARKRALGTSDQAGAVACGVSQGTFTRWRSGDILPTSKPTMRKLAAWLETDLATVVQAIEHGRVERGPAPRDLREIVAELAARVDARAALLEAEHGA